MSRVSTLSEQYRNGVNRNRYCTCFPLLPRTALFHPRHPTPTPTTTQPHPPTLDRYLDKITFMFQTMCPAVDQYSDTFDITLTSKLVLLQRLIARMRVN